MEGGGGVACPEDRGSTPTALSLWEQPQDLSGADSFTWGRDRFVRGPAAPRNYAQGRFGRLEQDGERTQPGVG